MSQRTRGRWKHRGTAITEGSLQVSFKIPPRVSFQSNLCVSVSLCFKKRSLCFKKSADIGNTEAQRSRRGAFRCLLKFHPRFLSGPISVSLCLCVSKKGLCVSVPLCFHPSVLPVLPSSLRCTYTRLFFKLKIDGAKLGIVSTRRT